MIARLALALLLVLASGGAEAVEIKVATWNMEWLTQRQPGDPLLASDVAPKRDDDLATLAGYAARLAPAVAALEEVDDPALVARVFPPDRYQILITADHVAQRVALVVRRDIAVERHPDLTALNVSLPGTRPLRSGLDVTLSLGGVRLRVLAVHLKSGCWDETLVARHKGACVALQSQRAVLARWIDARRDEGMPFLMLGDFNRRLKSDDPFLAALQAEAPMTVATAGQASPCWGGEDFIDQILAGGPARAWMQPGTLRVMLYRETDPEMKERLSDHCPVSVRLALP